MPQIGLKIRYEGAVPGVGLSQRRFNNLKKRAWTATGKYWFEHFRPKHFTKAGAVEYGYKKRKGEDYGTTGKSFWRSYTGRKQKKFGHTLPLVYSGELRDNSTIASIHATYKGVRVALPWAQKANFRYAGSDINMAQELTRVSPAEERILAEVFDDELQRQIDSFHTTQRKFYTANATRTTSLAGFFH